jgi:hypothetical protein
MLQQTVLQPHSLPEFRAQKGLELLGAIQASVLVGEQRTKERQREHADPNDLLGLRNK